MFAINQFLYLYLIFVYGCSGNLDESNALNRAEKVKTLLNSSKKMPDKRSKNKDAWGEIISGIRCGIRVNPQTRFPFIEVEYVIENVTYNILVFKNQKPWRFSIRQPDGAVKSVYLEQLIGSKVEVYMRSGDRVRGIIRNVSKCLGMSTPGVYEVRVTWISGMQEVNSAWIKTLIKDKSDEIQVKKKIIGKRLKGVYNPFPLRPKSTVQSIMGKLPPKDENIWGREQDGMRVGVVTEPSYCLEKEIPINIWIQNMSKSEIKWTCMSCWDYMTINLFNERGEPLLKTSLANKSFPKEGAFRVGSSFSRKILKGSLKGWAIDLNKYFKFEHSGNYNVKVNIKLANRQSWKEIIKIKGSKTANIKIVKEKKNDAK